jgi:protein-S-isoprenylcysteine O-methyltransferase Ste14
MNFARKALLVLLTPLLPILLFATAADFGLINVAGSPAPVKKLLKDSGIYNNVVNSALDQAQNSSNDSEGDISLNDPAIKKAAAETFNPQVVQQSSEQVIDGVYNWLGGKSAQPDFNLDLTSQKATFAQKVGLAAKDRAATLPPCTSPPTSSNPFSATCLPRGTTPEQVGIQTEQKILNAEGFLEHPNITVNNFKGEDSQQSVFEKKNVKNIPVQYQRVKKTPFILAILAILTTAAIIFLSTSRAKGLRHVGIILITTGLFMLVFAWVLNGAVTSNVIPKWKLDNKVLQEDVQKLAKEIVHNVSINYMIFGGIYSALGFGALVGPTIAGRKNKKEPPAGNSEPNPKSQTAAPKAPVQKAPPRRKSPPVVQG